MSMRPHTMVPRRLRDERGFTLIELLVSMLAMTVVTMAAFSFLQFTTEDVSHITSRVNVDQEGRTALENVMLRLHSACVAQEVNPVLPQSSPTVLKFVSQAGTEPAFATIYEHEIIYSAAGGTLVEKTYASTGPEKEGNYPFSSTASSTTKLLTGVRQTKYEGTETPLFQYYRYYHKGDTGPKGETEPPYGELNPNALKGGAEQKLTQEESESVVKVTVSFTLAPEGKEAVSFNHDRPVELEDSAVFRLAPSSQASSNPNSPCSETI
jgi:prepilin-type N-terminal cleavage/methylation domain-containing protein